MNRYINADDLTDDMINTFRDEDGIAINEYWSHQVVLDVIEKQPKADVVPYTISNNRVRIDLSSIREKIHGYAIEIYYGCENDSAEHIWKEKK